MTQSEKICNEIGSRFFCKDFVYENLKYFNESNNKVELCDGLFEYAGTYIALQIKERNKTNCLNDDLWLENTVYKSAVLQIEETIKGIQNNNICVNDLYHQPVELNKDYSIYALIVFDNQNIKQYKKVVECSNCKINIFSLSDYKIMMETIMHPYDILAYLYQRLNIGVPSLFIGEGNLTTVISKISTEEDFANSFAIFLDNESKNSRHDALKLMALINKYKKNLIKSTPNYKEILKILQLIKPECASGFMERFWYAWKQSCKNKFDLSKNILLVTDKNERIGITFFSVGTEPFDNLRYYEILCDAKQLQHKLDIVLIIGFVGAMNNTCQIDWIYFKKDFIDDIKILNFYNEINMFNGIDRKNYEYLAKKLLN